MANNPIKKERYDKKHEIQPLGYMTIIVDRFQEDSIKHILIKNGCSAVFVKHGHGSASKDIYDNLHLVQYHKSILFAIVNINEYPKIKKAVIAKFNGSNYSRGIIGLIKLSSIGGVTNYKFFSHQDYLKEVK